MLLCLSITELFARPCKTHRSDLKILAIAANASEDTFWGVYRKAMLAAANDLNLEVEVLARNHHSDNRFFYTRALKKQLEKGRKPDAVLTTLFLNAEASALDLLQQHQIPHLVVNTSLRPELVKRLGEPRKSNPYWLGSVTPDDSLAGYDLAKMLMQIHKGKSSKQQPVLLSIAGPHANNVSENRLYGLNQFLTENGMPPASPIYTDWGYSQAYDASVALFKRIPQANIVWTTSPTIARATVDYLTKYHPGNAVSIGTFDWSNEAINNIKQDYIDVSMGGHFIEGAWALILLYDYLHGNDFIHDTGAHIQTRLLPLTKINLQDYSKLLDARYFDSLKFAALSKCLNPRITKYQLNFDQLIGTNE